MFGAPARAYLAQSLPLVLQHRDQLLGSIEAQFDLEHFDRSSRDPGIAAMILLELLIEAARSIVESGELRLDPDLSVEHQRLGIDGRHYSRFGDLLVPLLKDITLPAAVAAAWCDAFWAAIRAVTELKATVDA
jgi:hypothetical protein